MESRRRTNLYEMSDKLGNKTSFEMIVAIFLLATSFSRLQVRSVTQNALIVISPCRELKDSLPAVNTQSDCSMMS